MQGKVGRLWPINSLALTIWCSMQHQHTSCYSITSRNYHSTFTCLAKFIFQKKCQILRKLRSLLAEKLENYYLLKPKFVYQCFLWAWQWSLMENYIILPHGFLINSLFDFVYAINLKNKPWSSMPNGRPMVNAIFPTWELLGSKLVLWWKMFKQNISDEEHFDILI